MAIYRRDIFRLIEAGIIGLFFVQAIRFLVATLYAHLSSASLVAVTANPASLLNQIGVVDLLDVQVELAVVAGALFMPLLSIFLGRLWFGASVAAILAAAGRVFMTANGGTTFGVIGAALTVGAGALYITILAVRRPGIMPACLILGFAGDQLVRAYGFTADVTWGASFLDYQTALSVILFIVAILATVFEQVGVDNNTAGKTPLKGEINGWGAFALGGLLYLQFAVIGLPSFVAHRVGMDYAQIAPFLIAATLLPLVPLVRNIARGFLAMFDGRYRGWVWYLTLALLLVIGYRFEGPLGAAMLIAVAFLVSLSTWWIVQPSDGRRNFTAMGVIFGSLFFLLIMGADFFTYEYAFVRANVPEPIGSLLRAFRGLGLAVALLSGLLMCLPAILARKRLPWRGSTFSESLAASALILGVAILTMTLATPVILTPPQTASALRVASLNLHGGYSLYFGTDLPELAHQINQNGIDILLLQEVETGRLISGSVDQAAWLARQLNMQVAFFPTNEALQGLAVLSKLPIERAEGVLLPTQGKQTGVQIVRVRTPDSRVLDVYNTHLSLIFRGGILSTDVQQQDQTRQILQINEIVNQGDSPDNVSARRIVIGGTFNQAPGAEIYLFMSQQGYLDPLGESPQERTVTLRLVNDPPVRVDYLWLRHIVPTFGSVAQIPQSNHNMAIVEIDLTQPAN